MEGKPIPPSVIQGSGMLSFNPMRQCWAHGSFQSTRAIRSRTFRPTALPESDRRRHRRRQIVAYRSLQPCPGPIVHDHRQRHSWARQHGLLAELWSWKQADDLPALCSQERGSLSGGASMWGSGFLPSNTRGFPSSNDPILHLSNPKGIDRVAQRQTPDALSPSMGFHQQLRDPKSKHASKPMKWPIACRQGLLS